MIDVFHADASVRDQALDTGQSFIVKAPAGSGKTQLLTMRLLSLLAIVDEPEDILAITFTKAATAEMRGRVLTALTRAERGDAARNNSDQAELQRAQAALARARERGWSLLEQPTRLNIQTIDSLCLQIAHGAPLLSRLGGQLQPTETAQPLYALAARRTLEQLGGKNAELSAALEDLLRLRDVKVDQCEKLIAEMLEIRDEWIETFIHAHLNVEEYWSQMREKLEAPFFQERERVLTTLKQLLRSQQGQRLMDLVHYACESGSPFDLQALATLQSAHELETVEHFHCIASFLLTDKKWRKQAVGFPKGTKGITGQRKEEYKTLLAELQAREGLHEALCDLHKLPAERFTDDEWRTIRSTFKVLLHAAAELRVVFADQAKIDFVELGLTAGYALEDPETRRRWSNRVHHLLVDEFQDTSRRQYDLIRRIIAGWEPDEKRTCFLVGDPMQSIYLFRQADVALFNEVLRHGFRHDAPWLHFTQLTLQCNFRSHRGIVGPLNTMFGEMAKHNIGRAKEQSQFTEAVADAETPVADAVHTSVLFTDGKQPTAPDEAVRALEAIHPHLPRIAEARSKGGEYRVAVLVRSRKHLLHIAAALRDEGIPYRATEIEALRERQEILDLLSLIRAMLSPLDRIAWLSILRAPWCGLSLNDLHIVSGQDDPRLMRKPIPDLLKSRIALLSEDGRLRAGRLAQTMLLAARQRFSGQFSTSPHGLALWVERTWHTLGGPHCVDANQYENVEAFFHLLSTMTPAGMEAEKATLNQQLERLFAQPAAEATEKAGVQLMTIHKAKGLGFDVVLLPGLERTTRQGGSPLLQWMSRTRGQSDERELLVAPIGSSTGKSSSTYRWVREQRRAEEREELNRLLYVACTRARTELHLFGCVEVKEGQIKRPKADTLLATGWPYLQTVFANELATRQSAVNAAGPVLLPGKPASPGVAEAIAAAASTSRQPLRRLPVHWEWNPRDGAESRSQTSAEHSQTPFRRNFAPGAFTAEAVGTVTHALFQQMASLAEDDARRDFSAPSSLPYWASVAMVLLRHRGLGAKDVQACTERTLTLLRTAVNDPAGAWLLAQRRDGRSESSWSFVEQEATTTVRADRVFIAGSVPLADGDSHLWIVDYKTTSLDAATSPSFLLDERLRHQPQLAAYGRVLLAAQATPLPLRLALYYPAIPYLDWWQG